MKYEPDFFKGEVRDDFYIEPMIKCEWAVQMDILEDIQNICKEHDIRYFADGGTLLGTIRHQGYIPWDDDIDLAMLRPDYDRFLKIIKREWKNKYTLRIPGIADDYSMTFTKIFNSDTVSFEINDLLRFHGCPYITGIDIFPLDTIPDDLGERKVLIDLYQFLLATSQKAKNNPDAVMGQLDDIEDLCRYKIDRKGDISKQLCMLSELVSKSYQGTENAELATLSFSDVILKKEWYAETEWKPFETMLLPVPKCYHEVLTAWYGDYMTPVQNSSQHDYPSYKSQMALIEEEMVKKKYGMDVSARKKD